MRKKRKRTKDTPDGGAAPQVKKQKTMLTPRRTPATKKGTHGDKRNEQKRLTALFESAVSGITHESERTIGFAAINHSGNPRRRMRRFENALPAYQEEWINHRVHIGTGYKTKENAHFDKLGNWIDGIRFGFPGDKEYRDHQYSAIDTEYDSNNSMKGGKAQGDLISHVGNAVQLNQLGYSVAYQHQSSDEVRRKQSNNSFYQMAMSLRDTEVPYYDKHTHLEKRERLKRLKLLK